MKGKSNKIIWFCSLSKNWQAPKLSRQKLVHWPGVGGSHTQSKSTVYTHSKPTVPRASPKAHKSNFPKVSLLENRHDFALSFSRCGISNIAAMYNAQINESDFRYFTHPSPTRKLSQSSKVPLEKSCGVIHTLHYQIIFWHQPSMAVIFNRKLDAVSL